MSKRCCLLLIVLASQALAQFSSAIQGTIVDNSQSTVPDAIVTATNADTGIVRSTKTSAVGFYTISNLAPGTYNLRAEKQGFAVSKIEGLELEVTKTVKADFNLTVGAVSEQVQVKAAAPLLETEQGRVSGEVDREQLAEIPLNGRNSFNLIALQPGMVGRAQSVSMGSQGGGNDSFAGETEVQVYASGQDLTANTFTIDGTSNNSVAYGGTVNTVPNSESIEEVRVVSNNFSAEEGRNPGARIQVITRAGTNAFHGTLSYYNQNSVMTSRNVFATAVPNSRKNQYGYAVGGPIFKNRTFFFTTFEGLRQSGAAASVYTVETPQFTNYVVQNFPNSIAAELLTKFPPAAYPTGGFQDLGSPVPGGSPTSVGPPNGINTIGTVSFAPDSWRKGAQFNVRIDHELRPGKDKIYGTFYKTDLDSQAGGIRPEFDRSLQEWTYFGNFNETHIFTPTLLNEFKGGVSQLNGNPENPKQLWVPGITLGNGVSGFPISSDSTITNVPGGWWQTNYDYKDTITWVRGTHTLKIGGELRKDVSASGYSTNYIPVYGFNSILDFAIGAPLTETRNVNPVTGLPALNFTHQHNIETGFFIQDDWKVTRRLTLNIGLRDENYGHPINTQGAREFVFGSGSSFQQELSNGIVTTVPQLAPNHNFNWGPRFGFAWDPSGKGTWTVRGGFGIAYDRTTGGSMNYISHVTVTLGEQYGTPNFAYALGSTACVGDGRQGGVGSCPLYLGYPTDAVAETGLNAAGGIATARISASGVDPNFKSPQVDNWFFGIQREINRSTVIEVNDIGSAGHHLSSSQNFNRYDGDVLAHGAFTGWNPYFSSITIAESVSNSFYSGVSVLVRHAFQQGFNLQGSYTFGKAIDEGDSLGSTWQDAQNRNAERGRAGYDATNKLVIAAVWSIPFFKGASTFDHVAGGWELSGTTILQSGLPMTVTSTSAYPKGDWNGDGTTGDRPDAPLTPLQTSGWTQQQFLTGIFPASSFPIPTLGTDGTLGRNTYVGPGFAETDVALVKKFTISERFKATLRMDAYNAFNRVNLNNPSLVINASSFGQSTSALTPRVYQAGLKVQF
jgi:hypothetical protein